MTYESNEKCCKPKETFVKRRHLGKHIHRQRNVYQNMVTSMCIFWNYSAHQPHSPQKKCPHVLLRGIQEITLQVFWLEKDETMRESVWGSEIGLRSCYYSNNYHYTLEQWFSPLAEKWVVGGLGGWFYREPEWWQITTPQAPFLRHTCSCLLWLFPWHSMVSKANLGTVFTFLLQCFQSSIMQQLLVHKVNLSTCTY